MNIDEKLLLLLLLLYVLLARLKGKDRPSDILCPSIGDDDTRDDDDRVGDDDDNDDDGDDEKIEVMSCLIDDNAPEIPKKRTINIIK